MGSGTLWDALAPKLGTVQPSNAWARRPDALVATAEEDADLACAIQRSLQDLQQQPPTPPRAPAPNDWHANTADWSGWESPGSDLALSPSENEAVYSLGALTLDDLTTTAARNPPPVPPPLPLAPANAHASAPASMPVPIPLPSGRRSKPNSLPSSWGQGAGLGATAANNAAYRLGGAAPSSARGCDSPGVLALLGMDGSPGGSPSAQQTGSWGRQGSPGSRARLPEAERQARNAQFVAVHQRVQALKDEAEGYRQMAIDARRQSRLSDAVDYERHASELARQAKQAGARAAKAAFARNNASKVLTMPDQDLHEQGVGHALDLAAEVLDHAKGFLALGSCSAVEVPLVCGRGAHSPDGVAKIRDRVAAYLVACGIPYTVHNAGGLLLARLEA